ncbi:TraV family lipoprotein [Sphingobium rhizovicinum]|uniref:TraV family lipoprotein n=1 Tax=Sphingobium rhizovicinum TaxID=432308 RepID=A0ABV7NLL2_9SPHN
MQSPVQSRSITHIAWMIPALAALSGCASIGSLMSPYSEKFSCKNSDHGQCIHPDKAYVDAVADRPSRSDPAVTNDNALLKAQGETMATSAPNSPARTGKAKAAAAPSAYQGYRDSVYRELQGLIDAPVTPMLRPSRAVRTLILPYADRARPDRLYMPRYVYSLLDKPQWVIGDYLVDPVSPAAKAPILNQVRERPSDENDAPESVKP